MSHFFYCMDYSFALTIAGKKQIKFTLFEICFRLYKNRCDGDM